jgi:GcrA cell cycle regulator
MQSLWSRCGSFRHPDKGQMLTAETWTPERIEQLMGYVAAGWSYGKISQILNLSRGSVIAKANRLGIMRGRLLVTARKPRPPKLEPQVEPVPDPRTGQYTLVELNERQCRWPYGSEVYTFCGDKVVDGLPYCSDHARCAYVVLPLRAKKP